MGELVARHVREAAAGGAPPRSDEITVRTLADLAGTRIYAVCDACPHSAKLDVPTLQATLRVDYPLRALAHGLRCTGCGARYPVAHLLFVSGPEVKGEGLYRPK